MPFAITNYFFNFRVVSSLVYYLVDGCWLAAFARTGAVHPSMNFLKPAN